MHLLIVDFSRIMTSCATYEGQRQLVRRVIIVLMTINQLLNSAAVYFILATSIYVHISIS